MQWDRMELRIIIVSINTPMSRPVFKPSLLPGIRCHSVEDPRAAGSGRVAGQHPYRPCAPVEISQLSGPTVASHQCRRLAAHGKLTTPCSSDATRPRSGPIQCHSEKRSPIAGGPVAMLQKALATRRYQCAARVGERRPSTMKCGRTRTA